MKFIIINLVLFSISSSQNADSLFQLGNYYYESEEYENAVNHFHELEKDFTHEHLYLNLGNSYYRMGELGNAVWAYEKGHSISPRDKDILYNLNFVRSQVKDRIVPPDNFFLFSLYKAVLDKTTILDIIILGGFFFVTISIIYLIKSYFIINEKIKIFFNYTLTLSFLILIWISFDKYWNISDIDEAIVISTSIDVLSAPIARGENVLFRIHEGTKVQITTSETRWYEILLLDGKKGWVNNQYMRKI
ncbi:MAG: SH3 domain-containing protein [Candidatus Neomarinimicrobiota bacterium]